MYDYANKQPVTIIWQSLAEPNPDYYEVSRVMMYDRDQYASLSELFRKELLGYDKQERIKVERALQVGFSVIAIIEGHVNLL